ncbi:MAG: bifunctional phosphoribosylaminoimidazolecarboxamide formyltransferase/IMP cyclohydrolase [Armatimonadetes bacterium CP1_7O]|jgi:phosphoribosylaminoimidazolecarboxamide formyltransferase/IMP cyclohydrolase|nr:MAG: bifunctional phosphoribosylaminoimidazolecarboxamide formyltransferase/IMP cyclohydrolase [Armatimonadetes bacterium CP1_7O]
MSSRIALISVSDKTGLEPFARGLYALGFQFLSTGGTARALRSWALPVQEVSEWTSSPEILDGRVKTLHPRIHAALLANLHLPEHRQTLQELNLTPIELVVVNLYPFERALRAGASETEQIEQIDIGGPTLLRAAAKNFEHVAVVVNPADYEWVLSRLQAGGLSREERARLAYRAFAHVAEYDALIADWFRRYDPEGELPQTLTLTFRLAQRLRYGENPHQKAAFYREPFAPAGCIATAEQLWGKELSYNNLLDADAALELVREFEQPACAIIKHTNPCGVALGESLTEAFLRALEADPVSAFGGIVACNRPIDREVAEAMVAPGTFFEVILAPELTPDALSVFQERKGWGQNVRLLRVGALAPPSQMRGYALRSLTGGALYTERDTVDWNPEALQVVTERVPTENEWRDLHFAWRVVKHVKSNAIVIAKEGVVRGIGAGQMNRVGSVRIALEQAGAYARGAVLASDAFFPFPDSIDLAAQAGIRAIVQPGGSKKDPEVIAAANETGIAMVFTGIRHFRH